MKFILLAIATLIVLSSNMFAIEKADIQQSASFYNDYIGFFNTPPKYVIVDESAIDISSAYALFAQYVAGEEDFKMLPIKGGNYDFITNDECNVKTEDVKLASKKLFKFLNGKNEFPIAIKIDDCYISNSDFLYLISSMIKGDSIDNKFNGDYNVKKLYFDKTIKWNSEINPKKYIEFTMDYEADRPENQDNYNRLLDVADKNVSTIGINPRILNKICYGKFCTLPDDYKTKVYSSKEIAWTTAVKKDNKIIYPQCYPYCGAINGSVTLMDEFIYRYGFPVTWHMTGNSIIAIAPNPELLNKVMGLKNRGLLDLGLHTMYHTNIKKVSVDFRKRTIKENYDVFKYVFNEEPVQFRAPYLDLPENYYPDDYLSKFSLLADNEVSYIYSECSQYRSCNYEFPLNSNTSFVSLDWQINPEDNLLNIYLSHPWELLYESDGNPVFLKESSSSKADVFKKWMYPVGEFGLIPTTPTKFLEMKQHEK